MALEKITEQEQSSSVSNAASVLVTQRENVDGTIKEALRRATLSAFITALRNNGVNNGYVATSVLNGMYTDLVKNIVTSEEGITVTFWDGNTREIPISSGGLAFDGMNVDQEGYLHITQNGEDVIEKCFIGTGSVGPSTSGINLSSVTKITSVTNGADAVFSFVATSTDDTDITATWYVDGIARTGATDGESGSTFQFNAKDYLRQSDTSIVKVMLTSGSGATLSRQWTVTSTAFSLTFGAAINPITLYTENADVYVVVKVSAVAKSINALELEIGETTYRRNVTGSADVTFAVPKTDFTTGVNTITATLTSTTDSSRTTSISYKAIWAYGATGPIVAFDKDTQSVSQFTEATIKYYVYDPDNEIANAEIQVGSDTPRAVTAARVMQTFVYIPQETGNKTITITCDDETETMTLTVTASAYNIGYVTGDSLVYDLNPAGHSNNDSDKTDFGDLTFSNGFDWTNGGFMTDEAGAPAFVIKKGNRATLPRSIFGDADGNGKTVDISFKIKNSSDYNSVAAQELNNGGSKGLILRANEGELRLNNTTGQLFRYCEDSRIDFAINVEAVNDHRVMTVWLDGVPAQVKTYTANTLVQNEKQLVLGSDDCDVWIYAIRVYNAALSFRNMTQNYIASGSTVDEKIARYVANDIYNGNGIVTPETLHNACPELTIVKLSAERMTTGKSDPVNAVVTIQDGTTVLELESGTSFKVQGTSSAAYGRSAYNIDIDFKNSGKTYKLSANAIPVNYINIKVNVASSECANNICAADWYNTYQPYLVPARETAGVRDTVEGKPCALFFENTSNNTIWIGSQQLQPGDTVLYAMGDICNSKKNTAVFGQDGTGEHPAKGCIEVSGNDTLPQQFKASSTYNAEDEEWQSVVGTATSTDYEWRATPEAEDLDEVVEAWDDAVAWLVSTATDLADPDTELPEAVTYGGVEYTNDTAAYRKAKFKAEFGEYFALNSFLFHYLYLEFYAAFDNVSKNTFYSYEYDEDKEKYLWNIGKNYDDDTILGCDNDGVPLADYGADFGDTVSDRHLFNADTNTIFANIKEVFGAELSALYITLRSRGAWTANTIISKWDNYQSLRPRAAMAEDAYTKYILPYKTTGVTVGNEVKSYDDSYLSRLQGSKTYQRRQFLTYQAKYMDGKYGYYSTTDSIKIRGNAPVGTTESLSVEVYAKTYVTIVIDNGTRFTQKIGTGETGVFDDVPVHSNATIYISPESLVQSIEPLYNINNSTFSAAGATKLKDVILGAEGSENTAWFANNELSIPSVVLENLSIRNLTNFSSNLDLSANVELQTLDTRGTQAGKIILPPYAPLSEIHLNACTEIKASNLHNIQIFSVENGNNLEAIMAIDCNSTLNNAIATLLTQSTGATSESTKRIRVTGVDWSFVEAGPLYAVANSWKGYDALGNESDTPVITGECYIDSISQDELDAIEAAFPSLELTYGQIIPTFTVTFKNYDGTVLYEQTVRQFSNAVEPVAAGLIATPTKPSTVEKSYTFFAWDAPITYVVDDIEVTATYTEADRQYTVRWWNATQLLQTDTVTVHGSAVFTGTYPERLGSIFVGWSGSAANVVADVDITAQFEEAVPPAAKATGYDFLYSDDPEDNSGYTLGELIGIINSGRANEWLDVGDQIKMVTSTSAFADTKIILVLAGFNHYKLADGSGDFAHTVFVMKGLMNATHNMNSSNINTTSWKDSNMRTFLKNTVFPALPQQWKALIKEVDVLTSAGGTSDTIITTQDKLFLLSYAEVGFSVNEVPYKNEVDAGAERKTFAIFTDNTSRIKKTYNGEGAANAWWLRSPHASNSAYFCAVSNVGTAYNNSATTSYGVAFGFCL